MLVGDGGGNPIYWPDEQLVMVVEIPSTGPMNQPDLPRRSQQDLPAAAPHQDLSLELIRHYTDLLRIMAERIAGAVPHAAAVAAPAASLPSEPRVAAPSEGDAPSWEAALDLLHSREWTQECVVALWLQHRYVLATHVVLAVGVTLDGHRRILGLVESTPEDVERIAAFLYALQARGVGAESGLLCTVPSGGALRRAAVTVWGSGLALQRCLRTKTGAVVALLGQEEARRIRHRLRLAWMLEEAPEAEAALHALVTHLARVNRSAAQQLREGLAETLTLQRTGLLLTVDWGLRVLHTPNALARRLPRQVPAGPAHQRVARLAAGLLDLESTLRKVASSTYLPRLQQSLIKLTRSHEHSS